MAKPKKKVVVDESDDDLAELEAFQLEQGIVATAPKAEKKGPAVAKETEKVEESVEDLAERLEAATLDDEDDASTAQTKALKNKLKREKKKANKQQQAQDETGPKKPMSQAAKLAAQRQQMLLEMELEQKRLEEEERKRREEEQRLAALEEEKRIAAQERKRQLRKEKRERDKLAGKPMTAKEKAAAEMKRKFLEQLQKQNLLPTDKGDDVKGGSNAKNRRQASKVKKEEEQQEKKEVVEDVDGSAAAGLEEEEEDSSDEEDTSSEEAQVLENWELADLDECEDNDDKLDDPKASKGGKNVTAGGAKERSNHLDNDKDVPNCDQVANGDKKEYRSPICCVLGHVDTGKTKLLDKIRHSNVQNAEAGGITQQIGATFFPGDILLNHCQRINPEFSLLSPGLLIIDTPGHESFNNLRARGSSLCDVAILVVDIMHGLEPQTLESIGLLRARKCYFLISLNKIDRMYGWVAKPWSTFHDSFKTQTVDAQLEFKERAKKIQVELAEQGLNAKLYWENDNVRDTISICPTSAITGEGVPDLIYMILNLVQTVLVKNIVHKTGFSCSVLEVKNIEGVGTTIDVILLSGQLSEGDRIVLSGLGGPICTNIRALLTPQPLTESRVKGEYIKHSTIKAAIGVKVVAQGLEEAVAGTQLRLVDPVLNNESELCEEAEEEISDIFDSVNRAGVGVYVMASTLGSLEALLVFLKDKEIPVFGVNLGTVQKKDVKRASIMREKGQPEYSVILAFDIKVHPEAEKEAQILGVRIMTADIIYHLLDSFVAYLDEQQQAKKQSRISDVVFPCELTILQHCIFNKKDPIVLGVKVENGILKPNTPLVALVKGGPLMLGRVASLEHNKKAVEKAIKGQEVCIKIIGEPQVTFGRHFDHKDKVVSKITRDSIDVLKDYFRDEMTQDAWKVVVHLKKVFGII